MLSSERVLMYASPDLSEVSPFFRGLQLRTAHRYVPIDTVVLPSSLVAAEC